MLLLEIAATLGKQHGFVVRAVHVDHGTQKQQVAIEAGLLRECQRLGVELIIVRTALDQLASNFEARARDARLKLLHKSLSPNEMLLFGHHLDDSYEWALLQSLRSSRVTPSLGIPVINGVRFRPLMCLSRKQISKLHRKFNLWHFEDASNNDSRFARNHLRHVIATQLAPRYPQYLRHYVARSNELARKLEVSVFQKGLDYRVERSSGVIALFCSSLVGHEDLMLKLHRELSNTKRSSVRREIDKLASAMARGRLGPHQLPGGVQVWFLAGAILLTNEIGAIRLKQNWHIGSQIPVGLLDISSKTTLMVAIQKPPSWIRKIAIKSHPLVTLGEDCVLVPWSRIVKIDPRKLSKLRLKHLNI